jgi:hypothetical protein
MTSTSRSPEEEAARRSRIERLAHQIWESEGRPEGQAERHWSMAERLVEVEEEEARSTQARKQEAAGMTSPFALRPGRPCRGG